MITRLAVLGGALIALIVLSSPTGRLIAREEPLPGWFDLAVPGGEATLLALNLTLDERAFTLPVLARALHDRDQQVRLGDRLKQLTTTTSAADDVVTVPTPLDASMWRDILPAVKPPASSDLFSRIVGDRNALLLAAGLAATTEGTRAWLARERDLLRFIYERGAPAFAIVARRVEFEDGRIVVPGGAGSEVAWEKLAGVAPSRPAQFLRALLTKDDGRLAWYYDTIGGLTAEQLAAAWPHYAPPADRAADLYAAFRAPDPQWRVVDQPYRRGAIDAWMILTQNLSANGFVSSPLPQTTWSLLFSNNQVTQSQVRRTLNDGAPAVSMSWLARETLSPLVRERRARYEMFRLAQRVFSNAPPDALADVVVAVSGIRHSRALALTLERMQIRDARTWAAAVEAARFVTDESDDRNASIIVFQATIALIERMRHSRTLDIRTAEQLIRSLSEAVVSDKAVTLSVAKWLATELIAALPPLLAPDESNETAQEAIIVQALAGPMDRPKRSIEWEGLTYVVDPVAAELDRLHAMRALLPSPGLDAATASERPHDLAQALTALVYATALGDPEGPASLSPDVLDRHEFGLTATTLIRDELPWAPPEERQGNGPWRVHGSLLGLDLGMSRLFLRRVADQQMPPAPTLTLNDLATLTRTGVALVADDLVDADRDEIAMAIARGRERVHHAQTAAEFVALARECGMSDSARQLLPWIASRQREVLVELFGLRDLMWLGKPKLPADRLDRWGVAAAGLDGRYVLAMPGPAPWEDYAGRSEVGQLTTQVPDLTLRLVEETARLRLPAPLIPSLLAFALEDYWHEVQARFADDWPRLTRQAALLSTTRIHDYVAALAGGGPLRAQ